ncbi:M23 family metallopeptidase [Homoserinibacter sp. YIM 151385]|uniref:M23 family metallopeptidase n=1 Tax=Homoserinibacter sp. YIM 151385 TaxID=2985506 RepID=UPI0022F00468|nr:M23 family metallopeptidase [Homoserinibacter sp. YIM 151385]WBU36978.1 M23 family metallopeptidase [Homoserinibacter sp. YIM 151385]
MNPRSRRESRARSGRHARPGLGRQLLSMGAMLGVGALAVGLSVPADAFLSPGQHRAEAEPSGIAAETTVQSLAIGEVAAVAVDRDGFTAKAKPKPQAPAAATFTATRVYPRLATAGTVRWPFPGQVRMSDGFGPRVSPCSGCSSMHEGTDFLPGEGKPIYAIASGVVTIHEDGSGGFGNYVTLTHSIGGSTVTTTYAHMQRGSSPLRAGQKISIGDFIGTVGRTGATTGPHLHLEIAVDGTKVDPYAWLQTNVG